MATGSGSSEGASGKGSANALFDQAMAARKARQFRESADLLSEALSGEHGELSHDDEMHARSLRLKCLGRMHAWTDIEATARADLAKWPEEPGFWQYLGEALVQQERIDDGVEALRRAIALDPERQGARGLLRLLEQSGGALTHEARPLRTWPTRTAVFEQPEKLIERYLLKGLPSAPFVAPDTTFLTLGSCFASNLGERLAAAGHRVHYEEVGEEVNSTFANRYLLEWIEYGPVSGPTEIMEEVYGAAMRQRLRENLAETDVFVMTLGVAAVFFTEATGEFAFTTMETRTGVDQLMTRSAMRTTTVAENVENIRAILATVRRLSKRPIKVVLTVSPVPMSATSELSSAVIADSLSKATLRLACHEALTAEADRGVYYWPSFEIVKWLGPHFTHDLPPLYGADDANSRHVSEWIVELIVRMFVRHFGPREKKAAIEA